jgi:excisionase family DNA binding protein
LSDNIQSTHVQTTTEPSEVLTVQELAALLRVTPPVIYRLVKDGKLPGRKVGGRWRFSRLTLHLWLSGTIEPCAYDQWLLATLKQLLTLREGEQAV